MSLLSSSHRCSSNGRSSSARLSRLRFESLCVAALLGLCLSVSDAVAANDEMPAIRAAVFDYFEGVNEVDLVRLERAFDEHAALKSVDHSGALVVEPIADAIDRWMQGEPATRSGKILSMELADGPVARVVFDYDGAYIDFLSLAKLKGQWKIIDKVFIRTGLSADGPVQ
ncbi:nuclear transport factor 2 family protein [Congregibacter variabilis]|uniref:Nuclear transport factor 2 family protein n=1 Tax=Congregibacter variabilis TaxID=3081200 RepID=A0ABZ0I006_9GAMM|nr:nuclear transport factor 2 family protein [Congregibacter sp. IMCC43200]